MSFPASCDFIPDHLRQLAPYQPGKPMSELQRELGLSSVIKLASNENPLGPSPRALARLQGLTQALSLYPDGNGFELKEALAHCHGPAPHQWVLGNGSNDVLDLVARTFLGPGTSAVYSRYAFAVYALATQAAGAVGLEVPDRDYGHDLDAMLAAIRPDTRVLFIANPNNPTGTFLDGQTLRQALARVPADVLVVLDEAYTEYLPDAQRYDSFGLLNEFDNIMVCRTFSKAYGLAGLRVGCAAGHPDIIAFINRLRQPFNVSVPGLLAAEAALSDDEFLDQTRRVNDQGRTLLISAFERLGLPFIPSWGNFVSVAVGDGAAVYQGLLHQGVIVRPLGAYAMPHHLRVTAGTEAENQRFIAALESVLLSQAHLSPC